MTTYSRSLITAFIACALLTIVPRPAFPSYDSEAGHKYAVASRRYADLRKSRTKKQYRSYWIDCARTFELVERNYPKSPSAADACFERADVYRELYGYNRRTKDLEESRQIYGKCQSAYPGHTRAPEALYQIIDIDLKNRKDRDAAAGTYAVLARAYPGSSWTDKAKARLDPEVRRNRTKPPVTAGRRGSKPGMVREIRYWSGGSYTRVVIEQNAEVKFEAQELKHPDRLVFDIFNASLGNAVDRDPLPVNDGILKQVRASQYAPDIVRVVLDLASIKSYAAFPLHEPERLVIDVNGEGEETAGTSDANGGAKQEPAAEGQNNVSQPESSPFVPPLSAGSERKGGEGKELSLSRQLGLKIKTIAIDAGHGGHDPGAIGRTGLKEKTVTLDVARRLSVLVKERLGCNVVMTRDKDVFIPLEDRPAIARTKGADLFVSIHVNANRKSRARGIETYVQGLRASDREAMATAARENAMSTKKLSQLKSELDRIFTDLTKENKLEESLYLADAVQGSLVDNLKPLNRHANDIKARFKRAFFYVLINTEMPSILAEVGFISNPEEERLLKKDSYRQSIAEALYLGVKKYVESRGQQIAGL